jgi:hypothetical protein
MPNFYPHSTKEIETMDMDDAMNTLNIRLADAMRVVDELESAGKVNCSAHYIKNEICAHTRQIIERRWVR